MLSLALGRLGWKLVTMIVNTLVRALRSGDEARRLDSFSYIIDDSDASALVDCCARCCFIELRLTDEKGSMNVRRIILENETNEVRVGFLGMVGVVVELASTVDTEMSALIGDVAVLSPVDGRSSCRGLDAACGLS